MRFALLVPVFLGSLFLVSWFSSPEPSRGPMEELQVTGTISAWRLDEQGLLYVQAKPSNGEAIWFQTPLNQGERSQFRELLTRFVHQDFLAGAKSELTFEGEASRKLDGGSWQKAAELSAVTAR